MGKKNSKKIQKICLASGAATVALGAASAGVVYSILDKEVDNYKLTFQNVYSIRDFTLHAYNKQLSEAGLSTAAITQKLDQVKADMDAIINNGKAGGFSADHIYAAVFNYAKNCQINVLDWQMVDDYITSSLNKLKTTINQTNLSKDKKDEIYSKYANGLKAKVIEVKKAAVTSSEAFDMLKGYSLEIAKEELADQQDMLLKFYAHDFFNSHKFFLQDYLDDATWLGALQNGDEFDITKIYAHKATGIASEKQINNFIGTLYASLFQFIYQNNNFQLKANFVRVDNVKHLVIVRFTVFDEDTNDTWTSDDIALETDFSPAYHKNEVEALLQQNQISTDLTMQEWVNIIATYEQVKAEDYVGQTINDQTLDSFERPIFQDVGLSATRALFKVNGQDSLADSKYDDFLKKVTITLNIFAIDTENNKVVYQLSAQYNDSQSFQEAVMIHDCSASDTFPAADQATLDQLKMHLDTVQKTMKETDLKVVDSVQKLFVLNTVLAAEQSAMAVVCGVFAGIYFAAAPETFGITTPFGVMATIGAAACAVGGIMSGIAAASYKKQYDYLINFRSADGYDVFMKDAHEFIDSKEGKDLANITTRVSYTNYAVVTTKFAKVLTSLETITKTATTAAGVVEAVADAPQIVTPIGRLLNTIGRFYMSTPTGELVPSFPYRWISSITDFRNAQGAFDHSFAVPNLTKAFTGWVENCYANMRSGISLEDFVQAVQGQWMMVELMTGNPALWDQVGRPIATLIYRGQSQLVEDCFFTLCQGGVLPEQTGEAGRALTTFFQYVPAAERQALVQIMAGREDFAAVSSAFGQRFVGYAQQMEEVGAAAVRETAGAQAAAMPVTRISFATQEEFLVFLEDIGELAADTNVARGNDIVLAQLGSFWRSGGNQLINGGTEMTTNIDEALRSRVVQRVANMNDYQAFRHAAGEEVQAFLIEHGVIGGAPGNITPLADGRFGMHWANVQQFDGTASAFPRATGLIPTNPDAEIGVLPIAGEIISRSGDSVKTTPGLASAQYSGGTDEILHIGGIREAAAPVRSTWSITQAFRDGEGIAAIMETAGKEVKWFSVWKAGKMIAELKNILKTSEAAAAAVKPVVYTAIVSVPPLEIVLGLMDLSINIAGIVLQSVWS